MIDELNDPKATRIEIAEGCAKETLRAKRKLWDQYHGEIPDLALRSEMCDGCPFGPGRQEGITEEIMDEVLRRIDSGEHWVCHGTAGPAGILLQSTKRCAGAPAPPNGIVDE